MDNPQSVSTSSYTRIDSRSARCVCLLQVRCRRRLQQSTYQGWRPAQGSVQDQVWFVRTNGHVLWPLQLPRHLPKHDEPHLPTAQGQMGKKRSQDLLRHGRDVHPTWVKSFTETLSNTGSGVLSTRAKSKEDFDSY